MGFYRGCKIWWETLSQENKVEIMDDADLLATLFTALVNEFIGVSPHDAEHHAQLFMRQQLCNLDLLHDYYCTMQIILYKITDHQNIVCLRHYFASMLGKVPELINKYLATNKIQLESLSFASLYCTPTGMYFLQDKEKSEEAVQF
jgi:hypothetical protein